MKISTIVKRLRKIKCDLNQDAPGTCHRKRKETCDRDGRSCVYCVKSEAWCEIDRLLKNISGEKVISGDVIFKRARARLRKMLESRKATP